MNICCSTTHLSPHGSGKVGLAFRQCCFIITAHRVDCCMKKAYRTTSVRPSKKPCRTTSPAGPAFGDLRPDPYLVIYPVGAIAPYNVVDNWGTSAGIRLNFDLNDRSNGVIPGGTKPRHAIKKGLIPNPGLRAGRERWNACTPIRRGGRRAPALKYLEIS